jgi:nucleotide-binding universal stress UspA family protein
LAIPLDAEYTIPGLGHPVVVATDLSEHGAAALRAGAAHAEQYGASLIVVHVVAPRPQSVATLYLPDDETDIPPDAQEAAERQTAELGLDDAEVIVLRGEAAEVIDRIAAERQAGCIVMGTHGRKGFSHALLGSVTEQVLRGASCGVLAVRA